MVRGSTLLLVLVAATACAEKDDGLESDDVYMDDDVPAGSCMSESGGGCDTEAVGEASMGEVAGTCESTLECADGEACIATFDGDIGEFECAASCIGDMDETRWCLDDAGCCEASSICSERGYCTPGDAAATGADTTGA